MTAEAPTATGQGKVARPQAIVFDWDNNLVESWPVIHDALNHTFRTWGVPEWTFAETKQRVRKSLRDRFPAIFGDDWEKAAETFYARYAEIHADLVQPAAGAEAALARLAESGIYLAVVSNKHGGYLRKEAEHLGWSGYFGRIVGAMDAERDKPDPAPVRLALAPAGLDAAAEVWFVGDTDIDLACAANAGLVGVLLQPDESADAALGEHPPRHRFGGCGALCNFIENL
jgi:phosphoglycolate phosphatase